MQGTIRNLFFRERNWQISKNASFLQLYTKRFIGTSLVKCLVSGKFCLHSYPPSSSSALIQTKDIALFSFLKLGRKFSDINLW
ncbi:hypothetical protein SAMD00079811_44940 [Scytonema sp. HK-05]|nr:hypothetical protein SAMD00079811_44940 [Scytonema sp. HK-05]